MANKLQAVLVGCGGISHTWLLGIQAIDGLENEKQPRTNDEGSLDQRGQRFDLAVTETVFPVRWLQRQAHGQQVQRRGRCVHDRIDQESLEVRRQGDGHVNKRSGR